MSKRRALCEALADAISAAPAEDQEALHEAFETYENLYGNRGNSRRAPLLRDLMGAIDDGLEMGREAEIQRRVDRLSAARARRGPHPAAGSAE